MYVKYDKTMLIIVNKNLLSSVYIMLIQVRVFYHCALDLADTLTEVFIMEVNHNSIETCLKREEHSEYA